MKKLTCSCGAAVETGALAPGTKVRCPKCKRLLPVPPAGTGRAARKPDTRGVAAVTGRSARKPKSNQKVLLASAVGLVVIVGLVFALKGGNDDPKPKDGQREEKGADQILKAHGLSENSPDDPKDAKAWLAAARDARANGFKEHYEKWTERAARCAPEDETIASEYRTLVEKSISALDKNNPDYDDQFFEVAERARKAGLVRLADDLCVEMVGGFAGGKKVVGFAPKHPRANRALKRVLTDYGTYEDEEFWEGIKGKLANMKNRDAEIGKLSPWQKKAFLKKEDIEKRGFKTRVVAEPPYLVTIQESKKYDGDIVVGDYRKVMETLYKRFRAEYAEKFGIDKVFEGEGAEEVLPIIVYDSKETYREQNPDSPEWAGGHFSRLTGEIEIFHSGSPDYETLFHEGTHQLVAAATRVLGGKRTNTHWLSEGIACYFESFKRDAQFQIHLGIGPQADDYLAEVQRFVRAKSHLPFEMFVGRSYGTFMEQQEALTDPYVRRQFVDVSYAQSWALVYFFHNHEGGKYRNKFDEYFQKELKGEGTIEVFRAIFGEEKALEQEWLGYIKGLKPGG